MENTFDILVEEYITPTNKGATVHLETLVSRFKNRKNSFIIIKGAKIYNGKSSIVYLVAKDASCDKLEMVYKNSVKGNAKVAKKNNIKNSYFDFSPWDVMRIGNGQITGSNMNMLNDDTKYKCYRVL